jgi:SAM-dependent methyltransferase
MFQSRIERAKSFFYNMRRYHNAVKRDLYNKYTLNINKLLDLACGKGGDLDKWISNNIKNVIGYDIDEKSIMEAKRRINKREDEDVTKVDVYVKDLSKDIIEGNKDCDVITSMFAFHYFFKSLDTFNVIMKSIDNNLKIGGYFIGTIFDGESVIKVLKNGDYILKDAKTQDIKFMIKGYGESKENDLFGNRINVYLKDTVLDKPMDEYIVDFDKFVDIMKKRGYELIETKMFNELNLYGKDKLNDIELSVSNLNRFFVFKRNMQSDYSACKKESEYLMECDWSKEISEIRKQKYISKYKKALNNKIKNPSLSNKSKMDYIYLRDHFEKYDEILNNNVIDNKVRNYYKKIYEMFLKEFQN